MIDKIRQIKDEMLMQAEQDMHEGGQVDPQMIDNIKDLAEAEKFCMESDKMSAETDYYQSVADAMQDGQMGYDGGMGYARGGQGGRGGMGYGRGGQGGYEQYGYAQGGRGSQGGYGYEQGQGYRRGYRRGYRGQSRDLQGRYTSRRGYRRMESYGHEDMMQEIKQMARQMMESADPQEKEQLKMQLRQMTEQM